MLSLALFSLLFAAASSSSSCPHDSFVSFVSSSLITDAAFTEQSLALDEVRSTDRTRGGCCYSDVGTRDLLRFSLSLKNSGTEDVLLGNPPPLTDLCKMGDFGGWELFECGKVSEWRKADAYEVKVLAPNGTAAVDGGWRHLQMRDDDCGSSGRRYDYLYQGVGKDCTARYASSELCQWVDITGLGAGFHYLEITFHGERLNVSFSKETLPRYVPPKTGFFRIEAIIPVYLTLIFLALIIS